MKDIPVIAIDGPSGSGKGSVCWYIAKNLRFHLLDSGAIYRVFALQVNKCKLSKLDDLVRAAIQLDVKFEQRGEKYPLSIFLDDIEVSTQIRTESCGIQASRLAGISEIRDALLVRQRQFRQNPGLVADGRDMGTVVFPDAIVKIFLTASASERAKRRHKELQSCQIDVNFPQVFRDMEQRDTVDSERSVAPLKRAEDAILIDTTELELSEVVDRVLQQVSLKVHNHNI